MACKRMVWVSEGVDVGSQRCPRSECGHFGLKLRITNWSQDTQARSLCVRQCLVWCNIALLYFVSNYGEEDVLICMRLAGTCDIQISRNASSALRFGLNNAIGLKTSGQTYYSAAQTTRSAATPQQTDLVPKGRWTSSLPLQAWMMRSYAAKQVQTGENSDEVSLVSQ